MIAERSIRNLNELNRRSTSHQWETNVPQCPRMSPYVSQFSATLQYKTANRSKKRGCVFPGVPRRSKNSKIQNEPKLGSGIGDIRSRPNPINQPESLFCRILVAKNGWQPVEPDVVKTLQDREAAHRSGDADGGESGVSGGGIRTTMVHRRTHRHTGWHAVVQHSPDAGSQLWRELLIRGIVGVAGGGVD